MPLTLPNASPKAFKLVQRNAPLLLRAMGCDISETRPFKVARPYPLYTFAIEAVLGDNPLDKAWLAAWEYLVIDGKTIAGLAEVAATDPERKPELSFATLHPPSYARSITEKIVEAEQLPAVNSQDYELRILRVPNLTALAIWLWRTNDHIILPIETIPKGVPVEDTTWKGEEIITDEAKLASLLRPIAQYRLSTHDE